MATNYCKLYQLGVSGSGTFAIADEYGFRYIAHSHWFEWLFFSILIRKENQKQFSRKRKNIYLLFCHIYQNIAWGYMGYLNTLQTITVINYIDDINIRKYGERISCTLEASLRHIFLTERKTYKDSEVCHFSKVKDKLLCYVFFTIKKEVHFQVDFPVMWKQHIQHLRISIYRMTKKAASFERSLVQKSAL